MNGTEKELPLRTFVLDVVQQGVVPAMETRIAQLNHTVTSDIQPALDDLIDEPDRARSRVSKAMTKVNQLQADAMKVVRNVAMGKSVSVNV